jgi:hypothetical protein
VDVDNPAPPLAYRGDSQTESFTQLYDPSLNIVVSGQLIVSAQALTSYTDMDPITTWSNIDSVSSIYLAQETAFSAPLYRVLTDYVAARFDGTGDWMNVVNSHAVSQIPSESDWTVSMVLQMNDVVAIQALMSQYIEAAGNGRISFRYNSGMEIYLGDDGTYATTQVTGSSLTPGQLYQVLFERKGNTFTIYVDNKQDATYTATGSRKILQEGSIVGARATSTTDYKGSLTEYFNGDLLKLEVLPRTLDTIERAENQRVFETDWKDGLVWYPKDDDRVVAWFDTTQYTLEGNVQTWVDLTGNVTTSQINTSTTYDPLYQSGSINDHPAIYFDGSSDHLLIDGISVAVAGDTGFTISTIITPDFSAAGTIMAFNTSNGGNTYILSHSATGQITLYDGATSTSTASTSTYVTGDVLILTWMLDPETGTNQVIVNGVEEINFTSTMRPETAGRFSVGQEWDSSFISGYMKGQMGALIVGKGYDGDLRTKFENLLAYTYFDVDDVADLALWLRADQPGTAYADLDPVSSWSDLSTNGYTATQGTTTAQPTYDAIDFDDNPSIDFDGDDQLEVSAALANVSSDQFSAVLMARNATSSAGTLLTNSNVSGEGWTLGYDASGYLLYAHEGQGSVTSSHDTTQNHIVSLRRNGLDVELGNNVDLDASGTLAGYTASSGTTTYVGGSGTETGFNGSQFEIACYNRTLDDRELYAVARHVHTRHVLSQSKPVIPNVKFEFDACDLMGYTRGQDVPTLPDASGTADATPATVANQAGYYPHVMGGHPALYFDGTDDFYVTPTVPATGSDPRMMAFVVGPRRNDDSWRTISSWGSDNTNERFGVMSYRGSTYMYTFNGYGDDHSIAVPAGKPEILIVAYDGTDVVGWVDGVEVWRNTQALNTGSTNTLCFGATNEGASLYYQGFFGWAMAAAHFPTNTQVQELTLWLARKFDVVL